MQKAFKCLAIMEWSSGWSQSNPRARLCRRYRGIARAPAAAGGDPPIGAALHLGSEHRRALCAPLGAIGCFSVAESGCGTGPLPQERKSVVSGKSVSVRVDLGGRRIINHTKRHLPE